MNKTLMYAAISGFLAVAFGAFGAHGIKPHIQADQYDVFQTGVLYHFIHTLVLLILSLTLVNKSTGTIKWAIRLLFTGILLFSGSLYLLSTRNLTGLEISFLGPVTPIGGLCFLAGWSLLAWHAFSLKRI
jgi:uncharacterized membrane protein YgdD (TMEM256/DUF423 family)